MVGTFDPNFNLREDKVTVYGPGDQPVSLTTRKDSKLFHLLSAIKL